jgi:hypothetical protein
MVRTFAEIMVRTVAASEYDYRAELLSDMICEKVELRFGIVLAKFGTIQKSVEHLGSRFCCLRTYDEDTCSKSVIVVKTGVLDRSKVGQCRAV